MLIRWNKVGWAERGDDDSVERCVKCPHFNSAIKQLCRWLTPNCVIGSSVALLILTCRSSQSLKQLSVKCCWTMEQTHISTFKLRGGETSTESQHAKVFSDWLFMSKTSVFYSISVKKDFALFACVVLEEGKKRRLQGSRHQQRGVALMVGGGRKSQDLMFPVKGSNSSQARTLQTAQ